MHYQDTTATNVARVERISRVFCLKLNECERAYLHKFRATYATMSLQRGMDLATLQEQLGHETLEATVRYLGTLKKKAR